MLSPRLGAGISAPVDTATLPRVPQRLRLHVWPWKPNHPPAQPYRLIRSNAEHHVEVRLANPHALKKRNRKGVVGRAEDGQLA
jgi:hypothetical protein